MKSGLAVMLELARDRRRAGRRRHLRLLRPRGDRGVAHSGLARAVRRAAPTCSSATPPSWASPPTARIEAGCQGTMRLRVTLAGARAHTARPWMGRNAIHRLGRAARRCSTATTERRPVLDGCEYREALQAVRVEGGVAGNVVPDRVELVAQPPLRPRPRRRRGRGPRPRAAGARPGRRATPSRSSTWPPAAPPDLDHPLLAALRARNDLPVRAKLGWTDVARFAAHGIPAANFGPGDADDRPHRRRVRRARATSSRRGASLDDLLTTAPDRRVGRGAATGATASAYDRPALDRRGRAPSAPTDRGAPMAIEIGQPRPGVRR